VDFDRWFWDVGGFKLINIKNFIVFLIKKKNLFQNILSTKITVTIFNLLIKSKDVNIIVSRIEIKDWIFGSKR